MKLPYSSTPIFFYLCQFMSEVQKEEQKEEPKQVEEPEVKDTVVPEEEKAEQCLNENNVDANKESEKKKKKKKKSKKKVTGRRSDVFFTQALFSPRCGASEDLSTGM